MLFVARGQAQVEQHPQVTEVLAPACLLLPQVPLRDLVETFALEVGHRGVGGGVADREKDERALVLGAMEDLV